MYSGKTYISDNLIVLDCDENLGRYYRSIFRLNFGSKLQRPSRGSHIVITYPGEVYNYVDSTLSFDLDSQLFTNGNAFWLNVVSKQIDDFRAYLGLGKPPRDIHFCIGYLKNDLGTSDYKITQ